MTRRARWIGISAREAASLQSRCVALAEAQGARSEPIVVWAAGPAHVSLARGVDPLWVDQRQHLFILIVPVLHAPGRAGRWAAWALAPAIAACRSFGVQAYLEGDDLRAGGRRIAGAACATIGSCAVIASSLPRALPGERRLAERLRAAIEAQFDWQFETSWPSAAEREAMAAPVDVQTAVERFRSY